MEYYEQQLNEKEREFYRAVYKGLREWKESVDAPPEVYGERFTHCVWAVRYDHPELFYVNFWDWWWRREADHYVFLPKYLYSPEETKERQDKIREKVRGMTDAMRRDGARSIYGQCKWIHDYMVQNCTYNDEAAEANQACKMDNTKKMPQHLKDAYTIEGFFMKNTAVCMGISFAYKLICKAIGIQSIVAVGRSISPWSTDYEHHAWNIVCAGDACAQIDVTWDMSYAKKDKDARRYDYFFLPDLEMMRDHQYVGYPICRQLKSSYFERMGTQFADLESLGAYVEKTIRAWRSSSEKADRTYLHFKMKNRKETVDEIHDYVLSRIRCSIDGSYSCERQTNSLQSIHWYRIVKSG